MCHNYYTNFIIGTLHMLFSIILSRLQRGQPSKRLKSLKQSDIPHASKYVNGIELSYYHKMLSVRRILFYVTNKDGAISSKS